MEGSTWTWDSVRVTASVVPNQFVVRWHHNEFDAAALMREDLRELYDVRDVVVGRLCGRCGSSGHGRPWARVSSQPVNVSWSRSDGHLLTVVSPARPVGVDVESLRAAAEAWPLVDALAAGESVGSAEEFALVWVVKEAILKARGVGLTEPMTDVRVADFEGEVVHLDAPDGLVAALALL